MSLTYLTVISRFWKLLNWKHKFVYRQYIDNFKISLRVFLHCITLINYFLDFVEHLSIHHVSSLTLACNHGSFSPHPSDCTMYQVCVHGYLLNMTCVYGTAWSQANSSCVDAATVNCKFQDDTKGISPHSPTTKKLLSSGEIDRFFRGGDPNRSQTKSSLGSPGHRIRSMSCADPEFFFRGGGGGPRDIYVYRGGHSLTPPPSFIDIFYNFTSSLVRLRCNNNASFYLLKLRSK